MAKLIDVTTYLLEHTGYVKGVFKLTLDVCYMSTVLTAWPQSPQCGLCQYGLS